MQLSCQHGGGGASVNFCTPPPAILLPLFAQAISTKLQGFSAAVTTLHRVLLIFSAWICALRRQLTLPERVI